MVEAWGCLAQNPKLRLKSANLESISKWIKEGSPADEIAITLASSKSKTKFIAEIDAVGGYRKWKVAKSVKTTFKVGDKIEGISIKQIKRGTTDKIVIIGRQMDDHVYKVAEALKRQGKNVEILDDKYLKSLYESGYEFVIEGKKWTVNSAWTDLIENKKWDMYRDAKKHVVSDHINKTPMFKLNKMWIKKALSDGATIIDIGYSKGKKLDASSFYDMEKNNITWD